MTMTIKELVEFIDGEMDEMDSAWEDDEVNDDEKIADLLFLLENVYKELKEMSDLPESPSV